jgi:hypothetical protein
MSDTVCKKSDGVTNQISSIKDETVNKIMDIKTQVKEAGDQAIKDITASGRSKYKVLNTSLSKLDSFYSLISGRNSSRPDLIFFRNILLLLASVVIVYYTLPRISGAVKTGFSKEQFDKATKLPETAFNIEERAKVDMEVKAFEDHKKFFDDGGAYDPTNAGVHEIGRTSVALPMLIFFLQFILPPLAIGYIIWFVITYWRYVWAALWGWFETMYSYFTTLIQGRLGCKWYIKFVTGWKCRSPVFSEYVARWRRRYIDGPVYAEKIKYINQYYATKDKYITRPYKKYIDDPIERRKINVEYAKRVAAERTPEVILKKSRDIYDANLRSNSLIGRAYRSLFGLTSSVNAAVETATDDAINGYESQTITGKPCNCPGIKQTVKSVTDAAGALTDNIKVPSVNVHVCDKADQIINNRASIMGMLIVAILAVLISIYYYTWTFGTPVFVKNIISPTTVRTFNKTIFKKWPIAPYLVLATTIGIIAHTGFS